jgi:ABC-type multidrug transport system ATPase subunit
VRVLSCRERLRSRQAVTADQRDAIIKETLGILEMDQFAKEIIGDPQSGGLTAEQRKRLTIGVELVANPSILFLDEPTSGLESRGAEIVMRVIKKIAASGRTVIFASAHRP